MTAAEHPTPVPVLPRYPLPHAIGAAASGAETADRERRLNPDTVEALTAAGFARHFVPSHWGGTEGTFTGLLTAATEVAEECASAAWCAALWAAHGRFAAYLPYDGQYEIWNPGPDVRIAAAVMPPSGTAVPAPGGWLLQGEWQFVSGVDFADWVLLAAVEEDSGGEPRSRVFAVPTSELGIRDAWHSTGLRGTGSNTVTLEPLVVPNRRSFLMADLLRGTPGPGRARCHTVPAQLGGGLVMCATALGAARHALRVWSQWAGRAAPPGPDAAVRETLARSSVEIDAAQLLLQQAACRTDTGPVNRQAVARNQRDAAFSGDLLVTAVERLFRTGGVHARSDDSALQRCWRDVHTVVAHGALRLEPAATAYTEAVLT